MKRPKRRPFRPENVRMPAVIPQDDRTPPVVVLPASALIARAKQR